MALPPYDINAYNAALQALKDEDHEQSLFSISQSGATEGIIATIPEGETWRLTHLQISGGCSDTTTSRKFQLICQSAPITQTLTDTGPPSYTFFNPLWADKKGDLGIAYIGHYGEIFIYNSTIEQWEELPSKLNPFYKYGWSTLDYLGCIGMKIPNTSEAFFLLKNSSGDLHFLCRFNFATSTLTILKTFTGFTDNYWMYTMDCTDETDPTILLTGYDGSGNGYVYLVDPRTVTATRTVIAATNFLGCCAIYSDSLAFAGGHTTGQIRLWKYNGSTWARDDAQMIADGYGAGEIMALAIYSSTFAICAVRYETVEAGGYTYYRVKFYHWNGTAWALATADGTYPQCVIAQIRILSTTCAMAIGRGEYDVLYPDPDYDGTKTGETTVYYWNGVTWTQNPEWLSEYPPSHSYLYVSSIENKLGFQYGFAGLDRGWLVASGLATNTLTRCEFVSPVTREVLYQYDFLPIITSGNANLSISLPFKDYLALASEAILRLVTETNVTITLYGYYYSV